MANTLITWDGLAHFKSAACMVLCSGPSAFTSDANSGQDSTARAGRLGGIHRVGV